MKITEVRIKLINKEDSKIKAIASMTFDSCFVIHDIRLLEKEDGFIVSMPSKKNTVTGKFSDIVHPINTETRELINKAIINAYQEEKAKPAENN
jgi:stage V sporulation protein G